MLYKLMIIILLITSLIIVALGHGVMIISAVYSALVLWGDKFKLINTKNIKVKVFFVLLAFSLMFEVGAIFTGYSENEFGGGTIFHEDPVLDILISIFYWVPFSLFWTHLLTTYSYSRKSIFVIGGLYGVITEQFFYVPLLLVTLNPAVLVAAPYLFVLYGSAISAPYLIVEKLLPKEVPVNKKQYLLPLLVIFPILIVVFVALHFITGGW